VAPDPGPVAAFSYQAARAGTATTFSESAAAADEAVTGYSWSFGDGTTATGASVSHTYATPGVYAVTLTVTDAAGCSLGFPFFSGNAGPFTGTGSACAPDSSAAATQSVALPGTPSIVSAKSAGKGSLAVAVACAGVAAESCAGTLELTAIEHRVGHRIVAVTAARHRRPKHTTSTVALGSAGYALTGGATGTVAVELSATATKLLRKLHKLPTQLALVPTGATTPLQTKDITVKPAVAHRKHN
jgi:hypothetical protein